MGARAGQTADLSTGTSDVLLVDLPGVVGSPLQKSDCDLEQGQIT